MKEEHGRSNLPVLLIEDFVFFIAERMRSSI